MVYELQNAHDKLAAWVSRWKLRLATHKSAILTFAKYSYSILNISYSNLNILNFNISNNVLNILGIPYNYSYMGLGILKSDNLKFKNQIFLIY